MSAVKLIQQLSGHGVQSKLLQIVHRDGLIYYVFMISESAKLPP